ncbi:cell division protein FtsQ/DivIB [Yoonia sp. R2331]|uniref:cell division protein FtsQ/DivIB n=1 Tax=Yoonia sp. R2331 TaxID=3237238 RepID=UPI0034E5A313
MRPLTAPPKPRPIKDPAPSKWGYRWQRMMLTPGFRSAMRVGIPLVLIGVIAATYFSKEERRAQLAMQVAATKAAIQQRPEFMVTDMLVTGADEHIVADVQRVLPLDLPVSSFDLDLEEMRGTVAALNAVEEARVKIGEAGTLTVEITPRVPVALWRERGTLKLIDAGGVFVGVVEARSDRLDLPLIAGDGAQTHIDEALDLFAAASPIANRVRGLVRMGERRWDMVLDKGQRILLPETGAMAAIDRVIALNEAQDLLKRDVAVVDMRNPARATLRLSTEAATAMRRVSETGTEE